MSSENNLILETNVKPRRPFYRSRKFWCVIIASLIPFLNHSLLHMDISHVYAMMAPWLGWASGEWGIDLVKSWHESRAGIR